MHKEDIKNLGLSELKKIIESIGAPGYRAKQIFAWIYKKGVYSFKAMDNLPRPLLDGLERDYYIGAFESSEHLMSRDRTEKFLFGLSDGNFIETVLIFGKDRKTICLSTQVGCKFACPFCASGRMGFVRDLTSSEIIEQILFLQRMIGHKMTNYVFMGMGEPLDNYKNTSKAVLIMNEKQGLAIGARRITISTCGVIPGIKNLSGLGPHVNLSVSLHASNDRLRDRLVPINKKYPLEDLVEACGQYIKKTNRMITLEYVLIRGENDSLEDAEGLAAIAKRLRAKVNLIEYSPVPGRGFKPPIKKDIDFFMSRLLNKKIKTTLRISKGADIQAACGQLSGKRRA